ncbi:putative ribonuclease H-like domain-containing protein [Tanacetum coccineum]
MMAIFHDMIEETMEVFIDYFSVFRDSFSSCLSHLDKMLKRCEDTNLVLNWEKCHFMVKEGIILGHKISKSGIEVDKAKVNVIAKLPHPTTVKGVRSFLGHAGFYRRFIQDFSKISRPMTHLLEKETPFVFSKECVEAFNALKKKLTEAPILVAPDWDLPFEIMCDASDFAVGAVLGQRAENLAADHLSQLEDPHQTMLENKEINETFPLETLGMVTFHGYESTSWFADFANYHAGNFVVKGMSSQQKKKIFKTIAPDFEASRARGFVLRSLELQSFALIMGIQYPKSYRLTFFFKRLHGFLEVTAAQVHNGNYAKWLVLILKSRFRILFDIHTEFLHLVFWFIQGNTLLQGKESYIGLGSTVVSEHLLRENLDLEDMELESTNSGPTAKLPILKLGEYEMWAMRIKQYFQNPRLCTLGSDRKCDNTVYDFMVENPNGSNVLHQDLEQIHEDDLEAMDLKWQLSLLSVRAKKYYHKTCKKIFINSNDIAGYDKSKVRNRSRIGINKWYQSLALRNLDLEDMELESTNSGPTAKLPILKLGEYEMWAMRIKQITTLKVSIPATAEQKIKRKNDVKARGLLLMAPPNKHQLTFSQYLDAKYMFAAIETRFGVIWMNKPGIETMSIDDLYNNFKIVKQLIKKIVGTSSGGQNLAFMTAPSSSSINDANTAYSQVSAASPSVNTASPQVCTASVSDNTVYAFMVENPNGSNVLHQDLEQIHEDDLEAMDLKWQLSLLSVRAKKYYHKTCKKIFINSNDIAGYDKSKVECYNCHKLGHFARECRASRSKEDQFRNQDNTRKQGNKEDTSKAMLAIDGVGFDWSDMAEEQVQSNMALMAFSDSEVYTDKTCSKTCLNNYETLKKQYDDLLAKQLQTKFESATYKRGLDTVEAQLVTYRKNEVLFSEEVVVLKREVGIKQYEINTLKTEFEKLKQEKDAIDFKIEKFGKASKDLDQLLGSQITDKSKKGLGYSEVPPPHPLIYNRPNKLDLSYSGLDEFKEPEFKGYGPENSKKESNVVCENESDKSKENSDKSLVKEQVSQVKSSFVEGCGSNTSKSVSEVEPKKVRKNDDAPIIEDWVSDDEEQDESMLKPEKKTVIPTAAKIEKPVKKSVRYAEMYRSQSPRGNQRNWNGQKSNQLGKDFVMYNKACYICGSFNHLQNNCHNHQRRGIVYRNNYNRVDAKNTHPNVLRNMSPKAVLLKTGLTPLNTVRSVNIAHPKIAVHSAKSKTYFSKQGQTTAKSPFYKQTALTRRSLHEAKRHYYTGRYNAVNTARSYTGQVNVVRGKPQLDDKGFVDSGCSRHMTGNIAYLSDFKQFDGGYVAFGGGAYGGKSSGKGTLKTDNLNFEDVYFVNELKFNLFSVSQMCDKKNYVLFTDTECLVLSPNFKLPNENQILLKIPRKDNMYSFDMKNIVPKESLTCLVAKATLDESMLWHRRLGHINFKNINKLVKDNLVRGLPTKHFENDQTCVACLKGKQHRASCKSKVLNPITKPLRLHGIFLTTKDKTSEILKSFIKEIENLVDKKVKIIRSDNGTEFKNKVMDDFCREKGIKREYSVARTPQQNGVAERRNRTLIEAARTMLADSKLPTTFWAEAVSTACYVHNRHHFIRDCNAKRLIQMAKIDTEHNVADLLTKGFNAGRFQYLVSSIGMLNP